MDYVEALQQLKKVHESTDYPLALLISLCWAIWKGTNGKEFEDRDPNPWLAISQARSISCDYINADQSKKVMPSNPTRCKDCYCNSEKMVCPPKASFCVNTDAAFQAHSKCGAVAVIIRNQ